jgi:hypothetical protein
VACRSCTSRRALASQIVGGGEGDLAAANGIGSRDKRSGVGKGGVEILAGSLPLGTHAAN